MSIVIDVDAGQRLAQPAKRMASLRLAAALIACHVPRLDRQRRLEEHHRAEAIGPWRQIDPRARGFRVPPALVRDPSVLNAGEAKDRKATNQLPTEEARNRLRVAERVVTLQQCVDATTSSRRQGVRPGALS